MSTREPNPVAILAARIMRAYPSLSPYSAASLAEELAAIERAQRRHAERCCSGADGGYVRRIIPAAARAFGCVTTPGGTYVEHDPNAEQRAGQRIERMVERWCINLAECRHPNLIGDARSMAIATAACMHRSIVTTQGDPRGPVLLVRLPGEAEAVAV